MLIRLYLTTSFLIISFSTSSLAYALDDIVELASAGNEATLQSIDKFYCKVIYSTTSKEGIGNKSSEYWRERTGFRIREKTSPSVITDVKGEGGKIQVLTTTIGNTKDINGVSLLISDMNHYAVDTDAWQVAMFKLPVSIVRKPPMTIFSLSELVSVSDVVESSWTQVEGKKIAHIKLRLKNKPRGYEVWVDPNYNWLITECVQTTYDTDGTEFWNIRHKAVELKEIKNGIFVPINVSLKAKIKGNEILEGKIRLEDVRINEPLPTIPVMPLPQAGSIAVDQVEGTSYRVDAAGYRSGPVARLGEPLVGSTPPPPTEYNRTSIFWSLACGLISLVLVIVVVLRRIKSRS